MSIPNDWNASHSSYMDICDDSSWSLSLHTSDDMTANSFHKSREDPLQYGQAPAHQVQPRLMLSTLQTNLSSDQAPWEHPLSAGSSSATIETSLNPITPIDPMPLHHFSMDVQSRRHTDRPLSLSIYQLSTYPKGYNFEDTKQLRRHSQILSFNEPHSPMLPDPPTYNADINYSNSLSLMPPPGQGNSISVHSTPRALGQPFVPDNTPRAHSSNDTPPQTSGVQMPQVVAPLISLPAADTTGYPYSPTSTFGDQCPSSIFSSSPVFSTFDHDSYMSCMSTPQTSINYATPKSSFTSPNPAQTRHYRSNSTSGVIRSPTYQNNRHTPYSVNSRAHRKSWGSAKCFSNNYRPQIPHSASDSLVPQMALPSHLTSPDPMGEARMSYVGGQESSFTGMDPLNEHQLWTAQEYHNIENDSNLPKVNETFYTYPPPCIPRKALARQPLQPWLQQMPSHTHTEEAGMWTQQLYVEPETGILMQPPLDPTTILSPTANNHNCLQATEMATNVEVNSTSQYDNLAAQDICQTSVSGHTDTAMADVVSAVESGYRVLLPADQHSVKTNQQAAETGPFNVPATSAPLKPASKPSSKHLQEPQKDNTTSRQHRVHSSCTHQSYPHPDRHQRYAYSPPPEDHNPDLARRIPVRDVEKFPGDIYTPKWKRRPIIKPEGPDYWEAWCGICGDWLHMKNSEYWRDMHYRHGIDLQTRKPFVGPSETRWVEMKKAVPKGSKKHAIRQLKMLSTETWMDDGLKDNNVGLGLNVLFEGPNQSEAAEDQISVVEQTVWLDESNSRDQSEAEDLTLPSQCMAISPNTPMPGPKNQSQTSKSIVTDFNGRKWSKQGFCELCNDWVTLSGRNGDEGGWWRHMINCRKAREKEKRTLIASEKAARISETVEVGDTALHRKHLNSSQDEMVVSMSLPVDMDNSTGSL